MMKYLPTVIQDRLGACLLGGGGLLEAQELRRTTLRRRAERMEGRRVGVALPPLHCVDHLLPHGNRCATGQNRWFENAADGERHDMDR